MTRILLFTMIVLGFVACNNSRPTNELARENVRLKYMDSLQVLIEEGVMDGDSAAYRFRYDYLLFSPGNGAAGQSIDRVAFDLLSDYAWEGILDSAAYQKSATDIVSKYQTALMETQTPIQWDVHARMVLAMNKYNVLSLQFDRESRINQQVTRRLIHANFRIDNGSIIQLDDVIPAEQMPELEVIAESRFRERYEIEGGTPWERTPFVMFADGFKLNQNFLIRETGLLFVYNPFDAATIENRHFEILIPWKKIEHLIEEGSLAQNFISQ